MYKSHTTLLQYNCCSSGCLMRRTETSAVVCFGDGDGGWRERERERKKELWKRRRF